MFTNRNKMIVALILAVAVAFAAYTMYAKSCACKKAAAGADSGASVDAALAASPDKKSVVVVTPAEKKTSVEKPVGDEPKPVLAI